MPAKCCLFILSGFKRKMESLKSVNHRESASAMKMAGIGTVFDIVRWIDTAVMVAGPLTKKMDATKLKRQRLSELKNGRLAMIGIIGCLIGGNLPGSVPVPIEWPAGASFTEPFGTFASYHP